MSNKKIIFIGLLLMLLSVFVGCTKNQEQQIREDYLALLQSHGETEWTIDDVEIIENYGTYSGVIVIRINRPSWGVLYSIEIDRVEFHFSDTNTPLVYKEGEFYELEEAYNENLLTKDDLLSLAEKINK